MLYPHIINIGIPFDRIPYLAELWSKYVPVLLTFHLKIFAICTLHATLVDRGRPNVVFFFGTEKSVFLFFGRKRCTYFRYILFFGQ